MKATKKFITIFLFTFGVISFALAQEKPVSTQVSVRFQNQLKTHNSVLSAVINSGFGKNFNDFVNEFQERVLLPENKHVTLLSIAFDSGFNSKATFNRVYKKMTGQSPKDFSTVNPN